MFEDGEKLPIRQIKSNEIKVVDISSHIILEDYATFFCQYTYKRELLKDLQFPHYIRGEDRVFLFKILCNKVSSFVSTSAIGYYYRQRKGSAMHSKLSIRALCNDIGYQLDIAELLDRSGKIIVNNNAEWNNERYYTTLFPLEISNRKNIVEFIELRGFWRKELKRLKILKNCSKNTKIFIFLHTNCVLRIFADFYTFHIKPHLIKFVSKRSNFCKLYEIMKKTLFMK